MANKERYVNYTRAILGGGKDQIALCGMKAQRKLDRAGVDIPSDTLKFAIIVSMRGIEKKKRLKTMRMNLKKFVKEAIQLGW